MKQMIIILFLVLFLSPLTVFADDTQEDIKITILYDNYIFQKGTKSDWGF